MLELLDYLGTFAFAISGSMVAVEKEMDIVGILVLGTFTGVGGGILRDLILGNTIPVAFRASDYFLIVMAAGALVFFFYKKIKALEKVVVFGDALGLGVFTVIGIEKGIQFNMPVFNSILMGVLTATFGGVLRDVLANRIPFILQKELYASLCVIGGGIFFLMKNYLDDWIVYAVVIIFITALRSIAYIKNWNLPKARL